ncbi:MAG TPA: AraC family transcriptional regulator [Candidatus Evtepia faecigallinarum]|nr:AraC family transcriptional regulator [Candidatus Evtepia faecigallinarum]
MLAEFLQKREGDAVGCHQIMDGVRVCRFTLAKTETVDLPVCLAPHRFEAFFCQGGCLVLERDGGRLLRVADGEILLLSDAGALCRAEISGALRGVLVTVDAQQARESLSALCRLMDLSLDIPAVRARMAARAGCAVLAETPWSGGLFACLEQMPEEEQGRYGVFKALEVLYLLCSGNALLQQEREGYGNYLMHTAAEIGAYMESHLAEKLTIPILCRRFGISQTALKVSFQRVYGTSLHRWLLGRRMRRAGELLRLPGAEISQVVRAVGYEGASQFYIAFKRYYGMTPGQYIKMSETGLRGRI